MNMHLSAAQFSRLAFDAARVRIVDQLVRGDSKMLTLVSEMLEIRANFESDIEYGRALALRDLQSEQPCESEPDSWFMQAYEGEIGADMQIIAGRAITAQARLMAQQQIDAMFDQHEEGATA